jgi:hypothetical protein
MQHFDPLLDVLYSGVLDASCKDLEVLVVGLVVGMAVGKWKLAKRLPICCALPFGECGGWSVAELTLQA